MPLTVYEYVPIVNGPGKFEGETGLTNWFWSLVMDGDCAETVGEAEDVQYSLFTVDVDEAEAFPKEVKIGDTVVIWEDQQGFVNLVAHATRAGADLFIASHQSA
jgi:hypothetical protein